MIIVILIAIAAVIFLGLKLKKAQDFIEELEKKVRTGEQDLLRFKPILDVEAEANKLDAEYTAQKRAKENEIKSETSKLKASVEDLKKQARTLDEKVRSLKAEAIDLEDRVDVQDAGLFKPRYDFPDSSSYEARLGVIRNKQKQMVKDESGIVCTTTWTVDGSAAKGRQQISRLMKLGLSAFNVQCDNIILKVKFNNLPRSVDAIRKVATTINKLLETNHCHINPTFLDLKQEELQLAFEYQEKLYREAEEQRQIREQMKEEERERKEMEKVVAKAERETQLKQQAVEKARAEYEKMFAEARATHTAQQGAFLRQQEDMQRKLRELEDRLEEAKQNERAISQAQLTARGHVYVISNSGSFGDNVFKIGMTRRLEPMMRVKELGDASVPFSFDVHAMIYTDDAPGLERALHKRFDNFRLNRVNLRKEFFRVSLDEICKEVQKIKPDADFTIIPEAKEYRQSHPLTEAAVEG